MILLPLLLTACVSTKTEYKVVVPAVNFPEMPEADFIIDNKDETCTVPSQWIINLDIFKTQYYSKVDFYKKVRQFLEESEE